MTTNASTGLFEIIDTRDKSTFIIAKSKSDESLVARFYIPPFYRQSCREMKSGDTFFGLMDVVSGYGYVCYLISDGLTDNNGLHLDKGLTLGTDLNASHVESNTIKSSASNCSFTLTAEQCAAIVASTQTGSPVPITHLTINLGGEL